MHCRRLPRRTTAFNKIANFKVAIGFNFAYYNFVNDYGDIRCTPAMAADVMPNALTVRDLVEMPQ